MKPESEKLVIDKNHAHATSLFKQIVSLSLFLVTLLMMTGGLGFFATRKLTNKLNHINQHALGPTLSFHEIITTLDEISNNIVKLSSRKLSKEKRQVIGRFISKRIRKVDRILLKETKDSKNEAFFVYLVNWKKMWLKQAHFINAGVASDKLSNFSESDHSKLSKLILNMKKINLYIRSDLEEEVLLASKESKQIQYLLFFVLCLGITISTLFILYILERVKKILSEKKDVEKHLQHQSKLASIGEMAAGVGHEINNPLAMAVGNLNLLKRILKDKSIEDQKVYEGIRKIESANERIEKIVDGLRTYSRSDSEVLEVVSMKGAVDQTVSLISEIYEKDGVVIIQDKDHIELFTYAVMGKLQQVIMNLISNAKDATINNEYREIHLSLVKGENDNVIFSVKDNGSGIPENLREKILTPFFTTKGVGVGTGMGLGVVLELIKSMSGELKIDSEVGKGSTFSVLLPEAKKSTTFKKEELIEEVETQQLEGIGLVVDDELGIRELLVEYLEDMGLKVDEADDGDTALEKVKLKKYDYICTDMKMPRMNGDIFIREAQKLPYGDTRYFIITGGVSSLLTKEDRVELREMVHGYIRKPFTEKSIYKELTSKEVKSKS